MSEIKELKVEKLTYQGSGLGHIDGMAVFVKNACPGDVLKVRITKKNKSYMLADIVEVTEPSRHRVKPFCPVFMACGSCHWQFIDYDYQLEQKKLIIEEAFRDEHYNILPVLKSPDITEYRHKVQCPAGETKVSKRLLIGYYKEKSHDITDIKYCPIQPRALDETLDYIRKNWALGAYNEKTHKGLLRHCVLRRSSGSQNDTLNSTILTLVLNARELKKKEREWLEGFAGKIPGVTGVSLNYNSNKTNTIFGERFEHLWGDEFIIETLEDKKYKISPQSFFQVNPKGAAVLFNEVKKRIKPGSSVLDAYGGVGAMGIWVSDVAKNIVLVEENEDAIKNAKENFKLNKCKSYEVFSSDAKEKFKEFHRTGRRFDYVILDPPRKGCEKEALEILSKLTDSVIYVSCNPQTLVRDVKILEKRGFKCRDIQGVDMFPHTYHIECVALLERSKSERPE